MATTETHSTPSLPGPLVAEPLNGDGDGQGAILDALPVQAEGHGRSQGRGGHGGAHNPDEIPTDLPKVGTGTVAMLTIVFVLLLAGLFVVGYLPHRHKIEEADQVAAEQSDKPVVDVMSPKRVASAGELLLPANARALQETSIYPRANGYLKRLLVDIGDHVKTDQLLAEIDTPEIDAQLNQSRASLVQAQANVTKSQADYELAQTTLVRYEDAAKTAGGAVTEQDLDQRRSAVNQAKSAVDAAKANVGAAEADVQRLKDLQSFQKVFAPFDGVVSARNYDLGALLSPNNTAAGSELFRITRSDTLRVFVNVPQSASTAIKLGQPATFVVRNFPGRSFEGKVTRTTGEIDPATLSLRMQIDIPNPDGALQPGMYGSVKIALQQDQPPLVIPASAMMFEPDGTKVAVVDDGNKVKWQTITIGRNLGTELEVTSGLSGGERIVTNPGERLADGMAVEIAPQKAPQPSGQPGNPTQKTQQAAAR